MRHFKQKYFFLITHNWNSVPRMVFLFYFFSVATTQAALFRITDRNYGSVPAQYQSALDLVFDQMETQVNSNLPSTGVGSSYLKGVSNATAISGAGLGVDYASPFALFELGVSGGFGAAVDGTSLSSDINPNQISGFSGQKGMVLGLNTGRWSAKGALPAWMQRTKIYFLYSSENLEFKDFSASMSSMGFMGQYKLIYPASYGYSSIYWGGLDLSAGYRSTKLSAKSSILVNESIAPTTVEVPIATTVTGNFSGNIDIGFEADVKTIPIEISSSIRFLYLFNLYAGLGMDLNSGSTKSTTSFSGPLSLNTSPDLGTLSGTASLDMGETAGPNSSMSRYFVGLQLEFGIGGLFIQHNVAMDKNNEGYTAGLRIFW